MLRILQLISLQGEEIIGRADVSEARRVYSEADNVSEKLKDGSEPKERRLLINSQEMPEPQHEIGQMEVEDQKPVLRRVAVAFVRSIPQQIAQSQKIAL